MCVIKKKMRYLRNYQKSEVLILLKIKFTPFIVVLKDVFGINKKYYNCNFLGRLFVKQFSASRSENNCDWINVTTLGLIYIRKFI